MPRSCLLGVLFWFGFLPWGVARGGDDARVAVRVLDLLKLRQLSVSAVSRPLRVELKPATGGSSQTTGDVQSVSIRLDERGALLARRDQEPERQFWVRVFIHPTIFSVWKIWEVIVWKPFQP